jgi:hypothetical protein
LSGVAFRRRADRRPAAPARPSEPSCSASCRPHAPLPRASSSPRVGHQDSISAILAPADSERPAAAAAAPLPPPPPLAPPLPRLHAAFAPGAATPFGLSPSAPAWAPGRRASFSEPADGAPPPGGGGGLAAAGSEVGSTIEPAADGAAAAAAAEAGWQAPRRPSIGTCARNDLARLAVLQSLSSGGAASAPDGAGWGLFALAPAPTAAGGPAGSSGTTLGGFAPMSGLPGLAGSPAAAAAQEQAPSFDFLAPNGALVGGGEPSPFRRSDDGWTLRKLGTPLAAVHAPALHPFTTGMPGPEAGGAAAPQALGLGAAAPGIWPTAGPDDGHFALVQGNGGPYACGVGAGAAAGLGLQPQMQVLAPAVALHQVDGAYVVAAGEAAGASVFGATAGVFAMPAGPCLAPALGPRQQPLAAARAAQPAGLHTEPPPLAGGEAAFMAGVLSCLGDVLDSGSGCASAHALLWELRQRLAVACAGPLGPAAVGAAAFVALLQEAAVAALRRSGSSSGAGYRVPAAPSLANVSLLSTPDGRHLPPVRVAPQGSAAAGGSCDASAPQGPVAAAPPGRAQPPPRTPSPLTPARARELAAARATLMRLMCAAYAMVGSAEFLRVCAGAGPVLGLYNSMHDCAAVVKRRKCREMAALRERAMADPAFAEAREL